MDYAGLTDENINQGYRNREDIRQIDIVEDGDLLVAKAYYVDKSLVSDFRGYWYGWQVGGRGLVWTPLGYDKAEIKKASASRFTEIHVYKYEQKDENVNPSNTRGVWGPKNK